MQRAGKKALAPILDTIRKNDQLTLKYKIREFPIANRLVGLPLASNSVSVSGAPQRACLQGECEPAIQGGDRPANCEAVTRIESVSHAFLLWCRRQLW